jgi:L-ascorbate metabolism protein UlaG (beta-lactamase superfamily)
MHRRRFLTTGAATAASLLGVVDALATTPFYMPAAFVSNPDLPTLLLASQWPGTPVDADGKFVNHEFPYVNRFSTVVKYWLRPNPQRAEKEADTFQLPVLKTDAFIRGADDVIVWLGHASFFIRLSGVTILIDPVLGNLPAFGQRLAELPLAPTALTGIDYVLLSHAHYDHCDKPSLRQLYAQNPQAQFLAGLGMQKLLTAWLPGATVQVAGWYQQYRIEDRLRITFLPARHWSNRTPWDKNEALWGAFVLQAGGRQVYFGGDSGYGSHFRDAGHLFPGLDVALIGAGAYAPRWIMAPNHQDPAHAVQAFHDTGAKLLVPMHYGTFNLSGEPRGEPPRLLQAARDMGQLRGELRLLAVGESLLLPAD